jgi:branched-chain amino acid transport system ATP-binding protein
MDTERTGEAGAVMTRPETIAAENRRLSAETILRLENVTKTFEGLTALSEVTFGVQQGHIKALIGPNGAGKTTLLNVVSGLLRPDGGGRIYLDGIDLTRKRPHEITALGIARTFQLIRLFTANDATVLDNVMLGAHRRLKPGVIEALFRGGHLRRRNAGLEEDAHRTLEFVGLGGVASHLPSALSFGSQRLVEMARALMAQPKLLLLDEPASGLNDAEVETFAGLLREIRGRGTTILLIEHNMKLVMEIADDIVVLDFGRKLAEGTPSEVSSNTEVIEAYLGQEYLDSDEASS